MTKWITGSAYSVREIAGSRIENYNSISGNPECRVRLAIPRANLYNAISEILGGPELWPYTLVSPFNNLVAVSASLVSDAGRYSTDEEDGETITNTNEALVDFTYIQRSGKFVLDHNGEEVYWDDEVRPRIELFPYEPSLFIWGTDDEQEVPQVKETPRQDELPNHNVGGQTLVHTIEGWILTVNDLEGLVGTVYNKAYTSPTRAVHFPENTLLLRSYDVMPGFSFRSYRTDVGGPTNTVKLIYEYRPQGWKKFLRYNPTSKVREWVYLRYATSPYPVVEPFPSTDAHDKYLAYNSILI